MITSAAKSSQGAPVESQEKVVAPQTLVPLANTRNEPSTINFPYYDLEDAVKLARGVHDVQGTMCSSEQLATQLGAEAKGGGFRLRISAASIYGTIVYERGGKITLTDLGRRIVDPQDERAARRDAFLKVPLYAKVFQDYNGRPLPPRAALNRAIIALGVGAQVADKARQVMLRSARQAGYLDLSADRLTEPPIRDGERRPAVEPEAEPQKVKNGTGGGDDGSGTKLHPLIQGLLLTLPNPPGPWPITDRLNWLVMANSIFKMIYPSKDQADIEIKPGENR